MVRPQRVRTVGTSPVGTGSVTMCTITARLGLLFGYAVTTTLLTFPLSAVRRRVLALAFPPIASDATEDHAVERLQKSLIVRDSGDGLVVVGEVLKAVGSVFELLRRLSRERDHVGHVEPPMFMHVHLG